MVVDKELMPIPRLCHRETCTICKPHRKTFITFRGPTPGDSSELPVTWWWRARAPQRALSASQSGQRPQLNLAATAWVSYTFGTGDYYLATTVCIYTSQLQQVQVDSFLSSRPAIPRPNVTEANLHNFNLTQSSSIL